jgi:hypothetical protein
VKKSIKPQEGSHFVASPYTRHLPKTGAAGNG